MENNARAFANWHVAVSGASKGIGKAVAGAFAAEGATLYLCARNETALYAAVAELQLKFPAATIKAKPADLSIKQQAIDFGNWINERCSALDVLVNNAGHFLPGSVHNEEDGTLEAMIASNLYSAYHLTRTVLPKMMAAKKGYIFNNSSIAALKAYSNGGSYSISKFAMAGMSKNLREELMPHNIKVCTIYSGAVLTDSWGSFDNSSHRIMEPSDIAAMIAAACKLSPSAVIEDIVIRPQLGDL